MAEQINYNPDFQQVGYRPLQAPDRTKGIAENEARFRAADAAIVAQMKADQQTIAINERERAKGMQALAGLSKTLTQQISKAAYQWADNEILEGQMDEMEQGSTPITYDSDDEDRAEVRQLGELGGDAVKRDAGNADIVAPTIRRSRFYEKGRQRARLQTAVSTQMRQYIDDAIAASGATDGATVAAVTAEATKQFMGQLGIDRGVVGNKFLAQTLYPEIQRQRMGALTAARKRVAIDESFNLQADAWNTFEADKDIATYLSSTSATVDSNGNPIGYAGAWRLFQSNLTDDIQNGRISQTEIQQMRNQPIPGDAKGRTYGQLHGAKFDAAETAARKQRINDYSLSQSERNMEFKKQEQELMDAFGGDDADGYTDEQIENAIDRLEAAHPGMEASGLRRMLGNTVDAKTRKKQTEQIEDLVALGLLTPERLKKFDRKLWSKYMSTAQQQEKMLKSSGQYKTHLKAIEDQVAIGPDGGKPIQATADGKHHPSVGMVSHQMQQYFMRKVQEYAVSNPDQAADLALNDTLNYFNTNYKDKVGMHGYEGVFSDESAVQQSRIMADARIGDIDDAMKNPNFLAPDNKSNIFTKPELEAMANGYGKPGWSVPASISYIAQKQGVDELTVLNKLRAQQGLDELESTPASEVVANELTPAQRAALANIGTPEVSARTMGSLGYKPELIPNGYAPMVEQAATSAGLQPAEIAAMADIESNWNPGTPSYNGSSFGLMQINRAAHPEFFANNDWKDPQASLNYGAKYFASLMQRYNGDHKAAAMAYNGGPGNYDAYVRGELPDGPIKAEMVAHGKKYMKALYKYGGGQEALQGTLRPVYTTGNIGPTSTGPHLDVKQVGRGEFSPTALDNFVEIDGKDYGRVPLSRVGVTGDFASHTVRGSHGIDYGTYSGSKVYLKNGAKVVSTTPSEHGDVLTIELPNGQQYTFLHGKSN
jgi:soluble lytic murein transglycosylase-like protein